MEVSQKSTSEAMDWAASRNDLFIMGYLDSPGRVHHAACSATKPLFLPTSITKQVHLKHAVILWDEVCIGLSSAGTCWCMLITLDRCHFRQRTILRWTWLCWYSICSRFWPVLDAEAVRSNFVILNSLDSTISFKKTVPQSLTFQVFILNQLACHRGAGASL